MKKFATKSLLIAATAMVVVGTSVRAEACNRCYRRTTVTVAPATSTVETAQPVARTVEQTVQATPAYHVCRPEMVSGARYTVFSNYLLNEPGYVYFKVNGTVTECQVTDWKRDSVTFELPKLGLAQPQNANIQIVMPDGKVNKSVQVLFVPQPDIVLHRDTIPQPTPPAGIEGPGVYIQAVSGGFRFISN